MGLDMYLEAEIYLAEYSFPQEQNKIGKLFPNMAKFNKPKIIKWEVAYWRKANQIHKWFIDNIADGVDECKDYYVGIEDLERLLVVVENVLEHNELAMTLLPPTPGFFFGGTEIDKLYFEDLKYTKEQLTKICNNKFLKGLDFTYHASW